MDRSDAKGDGVPCGSGWISRRKTCSKGNRAKLASLLKAGDKGAISRVESGRQKAADRQALRKAVQVEQAKRIVESIFDNPALKPPTAAPQSKQVTQSLDYSSDEAFRKSIHSVDLGKHAEIKDVRRGVEGATMRGQGKRAGKMVVGSMAASSTPWTERKMVYTPPGFDKLKPEEKKELMMVPENLRRIYTAARIAGHDHDGGMISTYYFEAGDDNERASLRDLLSKRKTVERAARKSP